MLLTKFLPNIKRYSFWEIVFFFFLIFSFFANTVHETFPDEFDNILGGWYIAHGRLPYIGFFTHHGPVHILLQDL